jgi:spermidine synthase
VISWSSILSARGDLVLTTKHNVTDSDDCISPRSGKDLIIDGWFHERGELWPGQAMSLKVKRVLDHHRSDFQEILVFESESHGNVLVLDGVIQVTERDEHAYQEMMAHIPLFAHPNPKKVLVIGGGDGGVIREVARHKCVEEIVECEIDEGVIKVSKKYLPSLAKGYDDPRVTVKVMDGSKFMEENQEAFDVIITDSSDPIGPASVLFETPFYNAMYKSLKPGGIVCTQGECMWLHLELIKPLVSAISKTFSSVEYAYTTIPTYPSGQIGFILATKGRSSCKTPEREAPDELLEELQYYTPDLHTAAFVLPAFARRAIFGDDAKEQTPNEESGK